MAVSSSKKQLGFSIIIPTYNANRELALAISSIKKNSYFENELIVVVDRLKDGGVSQPILSTLKTAQVKSIVNKENLGPYKNWNLGAKLASKDWLVFATDDQYFAPNWDRALWVFKKRKRLLTGQLVEPGLIPVWKTNIKKNFGHNPEEFQEKDFLTFINKTATPNLMDDGFFIPMVVHKSDFNFLGNWPTEGEFGSRDAPANDVAFIEKAKLAGFEFKRALNSFSYHFQGSSWRRKKPAKKISVAIISRPDEPKINEVLASVSKMADEIVVVLDQKTKGETYRVAQKFKAKIFYREFDDFSSQKNFAINQTKGDWVLSLDADEVVSSKLAKELKEVTSDLSYNGYFLPRKNIIFGQTINHAGWYPDYQLRFFVKGYGSFDKIIHERISLQGGVGYLKSPLVHYNYQTVSSFIDRLNRYTDAEARQLTSSGYKLQESDIFFRPIEEFFRRFFALQGWKDGFHGLALSFLMIFYTLAIYLKVWEFEGFNKQPLPQGKVLKKIKKDWRFWQLTFLINKETNKAKVIFYKVLRKINK